MEFELKGVPGTIEESRKRRGAKKRTPDSGAAPVAERTIEMLLDVSDDRFANTLRTLFPACNMMAKEMGDDYPAAKLSMAKKLPEVAIVCTTPDGDLIFSAEIARTQGKPELRIAAGGERMEMPLKVKCALAPEAVKNVDDAVGVDLIFSMTVVQGDLIDDTAASPKRGRKKDEKVSVPLTDNGGN
jgi:hypothetical protein